MSPLHSATARHGPLALLVACACLAPAHAGPAMSEPRISVWGVPIAEGASGDATAAEPRAASSRQVVRNVTVEQSRWGGGTVRGATVERPGVADAGMRRGGAEVTDVSYRWGVASGRNAVDVGVGAGAYRAHVNAAGSAVLPGAGYGVDMRHNVVVPTLSLGLRRSLSDEHRVDFYASGSAGLASAAVGEFYTAKVKLEWLPTKTSGLGFEQSTVSMKFGANSNFSLRVRSRGPMVYYRAKF